MTHTPIHSKPVPRLEGLDLARYLAFVGMVIVNFKIAMGAESAGGGAGFLGAALEGRAAATFVVLAGVGLGLSDRRAAGSAEATRWVTLKRALFLMAIGLLNMTVFDADILHYYAVFFLFGVVLMPLAIPALVGMIIALNIGFVVLTFVLNYETGWNWETFTYSGFWTPAGFIRNLFFNGWHPVVPWLGFLLFGIILSRLALGERGVQIKLILGGLGAYAVAETISASLAIPLGRIDPELVIFVTTAPVPPMPLYTMAGLGAASAVIGVCLLISKSLARRGVLQVVAPAGRQTLTLYIAHVLIGMGVLDALDMLGGQTERQALGASLVFCFGATLYAWLWSRRFKRGPIEAVMRKIAG